MSLVVSEVCGVLTGAYVPVQNVLHIVSIVGYDMRGIIVPIGHWTCGPAYWKRILGMLAGSFVSCTQCLADCKDGAIALVYDMWYVVGLIGHWTRWPCLLENEVFGVLAGSFVSCTGCLAYCKGGALVMCLRHVVRQRAGWSLQCSGLFTGAGIYIYIFMVIGISVLRCIGAARDNNVDKELAIYSRRYVNTDVYEIYMFSCL